MFVFLLIVSLVFVSCQGSGLIDSGGGQNVGDGAVVGEGDNLSSETGIIDPKEQKYEDVKGTVDLIPVVIDPDTGKVNETTFKFGISQAEERIAEINGWLSDNASWLEFVFGIMPEISWLFIWNIFFILYFFVEIVLNAARTFPFFKEEFHARIFGGAILAIMLVLRIFVALSVLVINVLDAFFNYVLPWGIAIAVILVIVFIVVFIVLLFFAPNILVSVMEIIGRLMGKKIMSNAARRAGGGDIQKVAREGENELRRLKEDREDIEAFIHGAGI